ncbi:MAG: lipid A biosynthesis lauroyl acyltransferase [Phyllobacteriaceae bacterium]|nr:lipid A biosynthesis lauroyl acyltransferase [Phyllobacteriaceae bacterium]
MKHRRRTPSRLVRRLRYLRYAVEAGIGGAIAAVIKRLPPEPAINVLAGAAQQIGPFTTRQRVVMDNLERAFPDMPIAKRRQIAKQMWRNMGRQLSEYVFLDEFIDFDPHAASPGRVEFTGMDIVERIRNSGKPAIFFTAHTGNFELLPICAKGLDLEVTALFRPPNNPFIAERVLAARSTRSGLLVPAKTGAAAGLAKALGRGNSVGILVDQKFLAGRPGTFFGHKVKTNPLVPRLAQMFDCPVHPARCVRLPHNRFRVELEEAITLPRDTDGRIDLDASAQMLNDVVERWVREHPDQWMWLHRRWDLKMH